VYLGVYLLLVADVNLMVDTARKLLYVCTDSSGLSCYQFPLSYGRVCVYLIPVAGMNRMVGRTPVAGTTPAGDSLPTVGSPLAGRKVADRKAVDLRHKVVGMTASTSPAIRIL
jgi:hypothetical protein